MTTWILDIVNASLQKRCCSVLEGNYSMPSSEVVVLGYGVLRKPSVVLHISNLGNVVEMVVVKQLHSTLEQWFIWNLFSQGSGSDVLVALLDNLC